MKPMLYKYLFNIYIKRGYKIWQMYIVTDFLYKFLDQILYIKQFYKFKLNLKLVYDFCKVLYRLK